MERILKRGFSCVFSLCFIACASACSLDRMVQSSSHPKFDCSMSKQECLGVAAMLGDVESALWMRSYNYADGEAFEQWTRIAAENGDVSSQFNYGVLLLQKYGYDRYRSIYWLRMAAKNGDDKSMKLVKQFDESGERVLPEYPPLPKSGVK